MPAPSHMPYGPSRPTEIHTHARLLGFIDMYDSNPCKTCHAVTFTVRVSVTGRVSVIVKVRVRDRVRVRVMVRVGVRVMSMVRAMTICQLCMPAPSHMPYGPSLEPAHALS